MLGKLSTLIKDVIEILAESFHVTSRAMLYRVLEMKEKGLYFGKLL